MIKCQFFFLEASKKVFVQALLHVPFLCGCKHLGKFHSDHSPPGTVTPNDGE